MIRIETQRIYWTSAENKDSPFEQSIPIKKLKFLQINNESKRVLIHLKKSQDVIAVDSQEDEIQKLITQNHWRELTDFKRFRRLNEKPLWALFILLLLWMITTNFQPDEFYQGSRSGAIRALFHGLTSLGKMKLTAIFGGLSLIALGKIYWLSSQTKQDVLLEWKDRG